MLQLLTEILLASELNLTNCTMTWTREKNIPREIIKKE
jgi:hypothetical protein